MTCMKKWVVLFRYVPSWKMDVPGVGLDEVWGGIRAETADAAWEAFLQNFRPEERDWYRRLGVEEQHP